MKEIDNDHIDYVRGDATPQFTQFISEAGKVYEYNTHKLESYNIRNIVAFCNKYLNQQFIDVVLKEFGIRK